MPGLVPGIHVLSSLSKKDVDGRGEAKEITHDLNNYGDVIHSPAIDLKVLSLLADEKYLVDRAASTTSLERLKAQVEAYRLDNIEQ
jgi:hypothetical protein